MNQHFKVYYTLEEPVQMDLFPTEEIGPMHWYSPDSETALEYLKESIGERYNNGVYFRIGGKFK